MLLKIAKIPYWNSIPYFWHTPSQHNGIDLCWEDYIPSQLKEFDADIALCSLKNATGWSNQYHLMHDFCIATQKETRSVLLFSKNVISSCTDKTVGVTSETVTSILLLKTIFYHKYNIKNIQFELIKEKKLHNYDAILLIGNTALIYFLEKRYLPYFSHVYDLGIEWYNWHHQPFVFARWIAKSRLRTDILNDFQQLIKYNLQNFFKNESEILSTYLKSSSSNVSTHVLSDYIHLFDYRMTLDKEESIQNFLNLSSKLKT